ncbi:sulphate transporter [Methylocella silvestris BL2]|uniref:Sulphate transporter n=1 Tax=Methylocella silvestris (strain DSM 15510 / CIP 108128 / LMG 27833 / NCIMB 13906 / BL2) TaxID=395965 RepID=B8ETC2_METSB|nr:SulP family inorganic anion transporter [Methylocella silvestris]ACK51764.1 sulphate transporter [Methylocella silvestris BL2]
MTNVTLANPAGRRNWFSVATLNIVRADFLAGLTVAALSLPQSMAYALLAGVDPRFGLYTAIVFTAVAAIFGSSRHLINGPTGAVSLVVFSALAIFDPEARLDAYEAMFLLTLMMGALQILIAVTRLGDLTRYISESVVTGFIIGAASLTIIGQIANALGVKAQGTGHQHVLERLYLTLTQDAPINLKAVTISGGAIALALVSRRIVKRFKLPQLDMLFVFIAVSVAAYLAGWSTAAPGAKPAIALIEAIPSSLPGFHIPEVKAAWALDLSASAAAIAVLGLLEALAIAKAIAQKSGQTLDYNRQILAEGLGNLVSGFFRGMPGAGSLSRTAINYQAGAITRFSGLFTAGFVAVTVLTLAPLASYVPKALLAGLLIVAAARLFDIERLRYVLRGSRYDAVLLIATAFAAIAINIEFAILIGAAVSIAWYVTRASRLKAAELVVTPERVVRGRVSSDPPSQGVLIYDFEGELFFGAAPDFERYLETAAKEADAQGINYIVLRLKRVRNPDVVALEVLDHFLSSTKAKGLTVLLAGVRPDLLAALGKIGVADRLSPDFIFIEEEQDYSATLKAIRRAYALAAIEAKSRGAEPEWESFKANKLAYYLV